MPYYVSSFTDYARYLINFTSENYRSGFKTPALLSTMKLGLLSRAALS